MELKLPRRILTYLTAGAILGGSSQEGTPVINHSSRTPEKNVNLELPDELREMVYEEHHTAINTHLEDVALLQEKSQLSDAIMFVLENFRIDFFDVTTGDINVSIPGEVHLLLLASSLQTPETPTLEVDILEAYEPYQQAVDDLDKLGFEIDPVSQPVLVEAMDNGTRTYYQMDLNISQLSAAFNIELPEQLSSNTIIPHAAQLVVEDYLDGRRVIRDILPGQKENQIIFRATDRYSNDHRNQNG